MRNGMRKMIHAPYHRTSGHDNLIANDFIVPIFPISCSGQCKPFAWQLTADLQDPDQR
jgi:hypothetical protein